MILRCTFEELTALESGARWVLGDAATGDAGVAAPPAEAAEIEALLPRLRGDLSLTTLEAQERAERAVGCIRRTLLERMDTFAVRQYPGAEDAVNAYFDYAHVMRVHERIRHIGQEMAAMIELMTGQPPTEESRRSVSFPDAD